MNEPTYAGIEMKLNDLYTALPSPGFVQGLEKQLFSERKAKTSLWQWWARDFRQSRRVRLAWMAAVILFLAACVFATPQGRTLAQRVFHSFLGYFNVTDQRTLPLPADPTPTTGRTYIVNPPMLPYQPSPAADPSRCGPTVSPVTSNFYCQLLNAQAQAGFNAMVFGTAGIPPLKINYINGQANELTITYINEYYPFSPETYIFRQGIGDFSGDPTFGVTVFNGAVKQVLVNNHPAELVVGTFARFSEKPTMDWTPDIPEARLRWKDGDRWYSIDAIMNFDPSSTDTAAQRLIPLGENLVPLSGDTHDMTGSVDLTPDKHARFHVWSPLSLPKGYKLGLVEFGNQFYFLPHGVVLDFFDDKNQGYIGLLEEEASATAVDLFKYFSNGIPGVTEIPPHLITDEIVQIGNISGRYMTRSDGESALLWQQGGVMLMLEAKSYPGYAGRIGQETLIAIAESIK